jgi:hypothetical protein
LLRAALPVLLADCMLCWSTVHAVIRSALSAARLDVQRHPFLCRCSPACPVLPAVDRLVRACAELPKLCEFFHIPFQSGDDDILREMARGYTAARYRSIIDNIRRYMPDASISGDAIVGFPGWLISCLAVGKEADFGT